MTYQKGNNKSHRKPNYNTHKVSLQLKKIIKK